MRIHNPFIHLLSVHRKHYMYDVNTKYIVNISKDLYGFLQEAIQSGEETDVPDAICREAETLYSYGLLGERKRDYEIEHPDSACLDRILSNCMKTITLQVTQNCNLRCNYCVYSGSYENRIHSNKRMDINTAKAAIKFLYEHSSLTPAVNVGFYGGEPLLEFDLLKECVAYAKTIFQGKILSFTITTNGTMLTEEIMEFLVGNDFYVTISLDGPKEIQDKNRVMAGGKNGSFEVVFEKVRSFITKYPAFKEHLSFNAVLDPTNDFGCTNDFFMNFDTVKGIRANGVQISTDGLKTELKQNEAFLVPYSYETFKNFLWSCGRLDEIGSKLIMGYLEQLERSFVEREKGRHDDKKYAHPGGPCLIGVHKLFVNVDGALFPCERVNENAACTCIGSLERGIDIGRVRELLNIGKLTEEECKDCWCFQFCMHCVRTAENGDELSREKKLGRCNYSRLNAEESMKDYIVLKECGSSFARRMRKEYL